VILDDLIANINSILNRITISKLNAYAYTQNQLHLVNVSNDQNYQRTFNGFYRVRLPITAAYATYYALIEQNKNNQNPSLQLILDTLFNATGRVETSFGSKLLATVNPNVAPLDSVVLGHLGLRLPTSSGQSSNARILQCVNVHNNLVMCMNTLITLPQFQTLRSQFQNRFPGYHFTDVKILDLLLWQYRP
jgi:hypothetical protein|tara:strand:- start:72 stop:644 length:573 start_codon:yes stop_codon:yes gene_type:complete